MSSFLLRLTSILVIVYAYGSMSADVHVHTNVGNIVGFEDDVLIDGRVKPITKFYGIPYAESTAGVNRFEKPKPKAAFNSTFIAKAFSPSCYFMYADNSTQGISEDCLSLNIFIPGSIRNPRKALPVMVWVHGGGFVFRNSKDYRAETLSAFGDVIVVTINYRLEMFGFLRSDDGSLAGNQGLWDQHLAFKWVHNNIDRFYGDPRNVTIFGVSAGSVSISLHALYPGNKGLFQRVITESGTAFDYWSIYKPNAEKIVSKLACNQGDVVICLKQKSALEIQSVQYLVDYGPVVDGDFLVETPTDIVFGNNTRSKAARELFASLDIMTGVCQHDGALYIMEIPPFHVLKSIENVTITEPLFVNAIITKLIDALYDIKSSRAKNAVLDAVKYEYTDWNDPLNDDKRRLDVLRMSSEATFYAAQIKTLHGHSSPDKGRSFFYEFAVNTTKHPYSHPPAWAPVGAYHGDDIHYVFGYAISNFTDKTVPDSYTEKEKHVSRAVMTMWTNFAKSGDPNTPTSLSPYLPGTWPRYTLTSQAYLSITDSMSASSVKRRFYADKMAFWLQYIPQIISSNTDPSSAVFSPTLDLIG